MNKFQKRGFAGCLNRYKALDANWFLTRHLKGKVVQQPALFVVGENDKSLIWKYGGLDNIVVPEAKELQNHGFILS